MIAYGDYNELMNGFLTINFIIMIKLIAKQEILKYLVHFLELINLKL